MVLEFVEITVQLELWPSIKNCLLYLMGSYCIECWTQQASLCKRTSARGERLRLLRKQTVVQFNVVWTTFNLALLPVTVESRKKTGMYQEQKVTPNHCMLLSLSLCVSEWRLRFDFFLRSPEQTQTAKLCPKFHIIRIAKLQICRSSEYLRQRSESSSGVSRYEIAHPIWFRDGGYKNDNKARWVLFAGGNNVRESISRRTEHLIPLSGRNSHVTQASLIANDNWHWAVQTCRLRDNTSRL